MLGTRPHMCNGSWTNKGAQDGMGDRGGGDDDEDDDDGGSSGGRPRTDDLLRAGKAHVPLFLSMMADKAVPARCPTRTTNRRSTARECLVTIVDLETVGSMSRAHLRLHSSTSTASDRFCSLLSLVLSRKTGKSEWRTRQRRRLRPRLRRQVARPTRRNSTNLCAL